VVKLTFDSFSPGRCIHIHEKRVGEYYRTFEHTHDFYEFFLTLSGSIVQRINGREVTIQSPALCLIEPADHHCFRAAAGCSSALFVNVAYSEAVHRRVSSVLPGRGRRTTAGAPLVLHPVEPALQHLLQRYIGQVVQSPSMGEGAVQSVASMLVGLVYTEAALLQQDTLSTDGALHRPPWLEAVMGRMSAAEHLSGGVGEMVRLSGKSNAYLSRSMQRYCGCSPTQFVNQLRLEEAARLLREGSLRVQSVMLHCGFGNMSHFCQLFRERYGLSPLRYRKQGAVVVEGVKVR
jgi:AraC family cel operon transcriptional repressor